MTTVVDELKMNDAFNENDVPKYIKSLIFIKGFAVAKNLQQTIIALLTKESGLDSHELNIYFKKIEGNHKAALIKLADRLHNSSTLYTFTFEKMEKYIKETNDYILSMASYCKNYYPQYTNAFTILKSNIYSLNNSMNVMLKRFHEYTEKKAD